MDFTPCAAPAASEPDGLPSAALDHHDEALRVLTAEAARHRTGFDPGALASHALRVTTGADYAVSREALEALLRRVKAAQADELAVLARPRGKLAPGRYRIGRGGSERQYEVLLTSLDPLAGSCSCPDYAKASLGVCKHLLRVATDARGRRKPGAAPDATRLRWDPVRPLTGAGNWFERLAWHGDGTPVASREREVRALFTIGRDGPFPLRRALVQDRVRRLEAVELLLRWMQRNSDAVEPAVAGLLVRERDQLHRRVRQAVPARELARHLGSLKRSLFPYQREGVRRFLDAGRLLLADDMGLGKTAQAIAACHVLLSSARAQRVLIVVPAALKSQWQREWYELTDRPITVVDGPPEQRAALYRQRRAGVLLVNYEQVVRDHAAMVRFGADVVILDEAQRIKNWATKTATYVKRLDAPWRLVMTGTPMENRLEELASIVEWVDDHALEPRWRLGSWHAVTADGDREIVGARNLDTLRARLAPSMVRRVRHDVLRQLPPRRDVRISIAMTEAQQVAHDDFDVPIAQLVARASRRPLTQPEFLRLMSLLTQQRILCNAVAQRDFEAMWPGIERAAPTAGLLSSLEGPKLLELRELVGGLLGTDGRKIVIFSQWTRMLRLAHWALSDVLTGAGARALFFTGQESQKRRTQNLVDFHDDPAARALLASDAGGVGLNLQRAASCCINLDLPWNPAVLEQRIGRVYRMGQELPVEVYNFVAETGIEGRIAAVIRDKKALFNGLFDGASDAVEFDRAGSFLARLEAIVKAPDLPVLDDGSDEDAVGTDPSADSGGVEIATPVPPAAAVDAGALAALVGQISVSQLADGRVSVTAPPAAASLFASMLRGLADALTRSGDGA